MADNKNDEDKKNEQRPLDPTRSGGDLVGDTTGMTGITTGSSEQISATPNDKPKNENKEHLPGGIDTSYQTTPVGEVPRESIDDIKYKKDAARGESQTYANNANDIASEVKGGDNKPGEKIIDPDTINDTVDEFLWSAISDKSENEADPTNIDIKNTSSLMDEETATGIDINDNNNVGENSPSELGEQSISGTTPDPSSDDDTLENAHIMGEQMNEDEENPKEIDIARDIDEAEEDLRTH